MYRRAESIDYLYRWTHNCRLYTQRELQTTKASFNYVKGSNVKFMLLQDIVVRVVLYFLWCVGGYES